MSSVILQAGYSGHRANKESPLLSEHCAKLLIQVLTGSKETAREAWQVWRSNYQLTKIEDHSVRRLLPYLLKRYATQGIALTDSIYIRNLYLQTWQNNIDRMRLACELARFLREAEINYVFLKGIALLAGYYNNPGERVVSDIDILIERSSVPKFIKFIEEKGWMFAEDPWNQVLSPLSHAASFENEDKCPIDIHWSLLHEWLSDDLEQDIFTRSRVLLVHGEELRVPSPEDLFFHVIVHGMRNTTKQFYWIMDALQVLEFADYNLDWKIVLENGKRLRVLEYLDRALHELSEIPGIKIPDEVVKTLEKTPRKFVEKAERLFPSYHLRCSMAGLFIRPISRVIRSNPAGQRFGRVSNIFSVLRKELSFLCKHYTWLPFHPSFHQSNSPPESNDVSAHPIAKNNGKI